MPNFIYPSERVLPYVYMGTHRVTGQFYIGARCANKNPSHIDLGTHYFTSSKIVKPSFNDFNWKIIFEGFDKQIVFEVEAILQEEEKKNPLSLNVCIKGKFNGSYKKREPFTEEHKQRISKGKKGKKLKPFSEEHKRNLSIARNNVSPEWNVKISKANLSRSEEISIRCRNTFKDKPLSEDHKKKLSKAKTGSTLSKETKAKISKANKDRIFSEDHKVKISESNKGKHSQRLICPHCGKEGGVIMKRWHFNNCKFKS